MNNCEKKGSNDKHKWEFKHPHACKLCSQVVTKRKSMLSRRFGILDKCTHVFCYYCIRGFVQCKIELDRKVWENGDKNFVEKSIFCPICKVHSGRIMASQRLIIDTYEKIKFELEYEKCMETLECECIKRGIGYCYCTPKHILLKKDEQD